MASEERKDAVVVATAAVASFNRPPQPKKEDHLDEIERHLLGLITAVGKLREEMNK